MQCLHRIPPAVCSLKVFSGAKFRFESKKKKKISGDLNSTLSCYLGLSWSKPKAIQGWCD